MEPVVSIVVPCYNDGAFLSEAVESVKRCSEGFCELVIVDDGSTDPATLEVLEGLRRKGNDVLTQKNLGLAAARNNGIARSRGRYVLPLDADNRIRPEYPLIGARILDRSPKVGVVYGDAEYFGSRTGPWKVPDFNYTRLLIGNYIDACAVFRRQCWEECGGYDGAMPYQGMEDWDFWLRVAQRGWRFRHVKRPLFDYRVRQGSMLNGCNPRIELMEALTKYMTVKHANAMRTEVLRLSRPWPLQLRTAVGAALRRAGLLKRK